MKESVSLQSRAFYKIIWLFVLIFIVIALASILAIRDETRHDAKRNLQVRTQVVEQVFNDYLTRAEYEMGYISQDLVLGDYQPGNELEMLFSHHEVLFFGGLDFFYIDWSHRSSATDPRARIYTQESLPELLSIGQINRWVKVVTKDDAILLMYKKKLVSKGRILQGYLYGFVSLNNNLALSSELLDGANADLVSLYDKHLGRVLLKESRVDFDASDSVVSISSDLVTHVYGSQLLLNITKRMPISDSMVSAWIRVLLFSFFMLIGLYVALVLLMKRLIFTPLNIIAQYPESEQVVFSELQPIQAKSLQYRSYLNAKESRFQLLLESTYSAIIFCNEMADVKKINREAMRLFPRYEHTRTVFDFMPITCHQAIQDALKDGVGITFELTISHINRIYDWQIYSFTNENAFRSIVLIGRDVTQERRLSWQLEQLKPSSLDLSQRLDIDVLLGEMAFLSKLPTHYPQGYLQGWLGLILVTLEEMQTKVNTVELETIGNILHRESVYVMNRLGFNIADMSIDCPVSSGATVISADIYLTSLLRLTLMMAVADAMPEKSISIRFDGGVLEIIVSNDMALRPFFHWISMLVMKQPGGQVHSGTKALRIQIPFEMYSKERVSLSNDLVVAWVVNDYPDPDKIQTSLERLGIQVDVYFSSDSFFMQASSTAHFDAVIIGCDKELDDQCRMTKDLEAHYHRTDLPIIWLNTYLEKAIEFDVLSVCGCVFDYSLHQAILLATKRLAIIPTQQAEQEAFWVVVGGTRVMRAIWYTELEQQYIASQWLADLSDYREVLSYHPAAVVVLLEPHSKTLLTRIQSDYPQVSLVAVQEWPSCPANVSVFEMTLPYSGEQISALKEFVQCKITL